MTTAGWLIFSFFLFLSRHAHLPALTTMSLLRILLPLSSIFLAVACSAQVSPVLTSPDAATSDAGPTDQDAAPAPQACASAGGTCGAISECAAGLGQLGSDKYTCGGGAPGTNVCCFKAPSTCASEATFECCGSGATFRPVCEDGALRCLPGMTKAGAGGCNGAPDGGPGCTYQDVPGTATIKAIEVPGAAENSCPKDGRRLVFDFAPTDSTAPASYKFPQTADTSRNWTIGDGKHPPLNCLAPLGLRVGAQVAGKRREILTGTCTPVIFDLAIDAATCAAQCF